MVQKIEVPKMKILKIMKNLANEEISMSTRTLGDIIGVHRDTMRKWLRELKTEGLVYDDGVSNNPLQKTTNSDAVSNSNKWHLTQNGKSALETPVRAPDILVHNAYKYDTFGFDVQCDYVQFLTPEERDLNVKLSSHLKQGDYTLLDHVGVAFQHLVAVYEEAPNSEYTKILCDDMKNILDEPSPEIIASKLVEFKNHLADALARADPTNETDIITCFTGKTIKFNVPKPDMEKKDKEQPSVPTQSKRHSSVSTHVKKHPAVPTQSKRQPT